MKTPALPPAQITLANVFRAFFGSTAALSLGLLTLTTATASADTIVEFTFAPAPSATYPTGVLFDDESTTSPGLTGYVGTVAAGSTFTTASGQTFTMDVGDPIEGVPQGFTGIGVNDVVIGLEGGDQLILGNEQPPAAGPQLWELVNPSNDGLLNIGLGSWVVDSNGGGGGNGGSSAPDGGSTFLMSLGSLTLLGAAARRFKRVSA